MADAVVSAVINKAVDIGANLILEEGHRLYWLQEDIGWLEREMRHMQGYLQNAESKKSTNPNVDNLIKDIRDLVHDAEDILDIYLPQIESHGSSGLLKGMSTCFLPYCWTSSLFSKEIEKIKMRLKDIDEKRKTYNVEDMSGTDDVSNVDPRTTKLHVDDPIIVGFEEDVEELKNKLKEHPFVSIVGMAGLGKTTLAKKVFKGIKDNFERCASVSVSQKPIIENLVKDIAQQVGLEKEKQEKNLEKNLYSFLQGKRYVVLFDDIWDTKAWDSLKTYFPIGSESASRIIITSRNNGVGRYIGGQNSLHQLHPLDDSKSWELFSKLIMRTNKKFDSKLEDTGGKIVKKCGGIPLAIVVIVGMLTERGMSEFDWNLILHSIGENASDDCSQILGLSYRDLPTFLKPCFLYFGNFPEDYEFSASEVIRLWMAEKFIPLVGGDWEPEDVGADYISKLEARNLILVVKRGHDGRVKKFCIHDLLHSFCVNKGREIDFLNTDDHLESSSAKRVRRLSVHYHSIAESEKVISQMTKLRALFHFKFDKKIEIKCLDNMLARFKLLQVLKLVAFVFEDVCIPSQIRSLSRLNYLEIDSESQVKIPSSIRDLEKLQTLDLRGCQCGVKLPIGIWKMEQLRHLLLRYYVIDYSLMRLLCKYQQVQVLLPNLQTLSRIRCFDLKPTWLQKLTNLRKLELDDVTPEIMEVLCGAEPISKKLEVLSLRWWGSDCSMNRRVSLAKYERLMKLTIIEVKMQQLPELPPSLIKLTLFATKLIEDPMKILKNLPKLKILNLYWNAFVGSKMDCSGAERFPQLEILQLCGLSELEELIEGEEMGMPKLKQLIIEYCPKLVRVPKRLQECLRMEN
ncbi:Apoptotic ATPase [Handroanthus impetiginosus]|uniref:Apoptotic ATPase n=1 Tax=Handroanthus impetiginosus TaxID=429701 RepID=A0A2G9GSJ1_9LAMI|nr:Apoptotic ATPase [Handroanthus impetiginosus]